MNDGPSGGGRDDGHTALHRWTPTLLEGRDDLKRKIDKILKRTTPVPHSNDSVYAYVENVAKNNVANGNRD